MRRCDHTRHPGCLAVRKVGHVPADFSALQRPGHVSVVDQQVPGIIEHDHTFLHLRDGVRVQRFPRGIQQRYMDRDVIALFVERFHLLHHLYGAGQAKRAAHRQVRIISDHVHSKRISRIGNFNSDRAKSDDAERLASDLRSGKLFFALFHGHGNVLVVLMFPDPCDAAVNIPGSEQHTRQYQFLHTVRVGTRGIEDHDSFFRTFVERNVVYARACPGDRFQSVRQFHFMHGCAPHQDALGFAGILCYFIVSGQSFQSRL